MENFGNDWDMILKDELQKNYFKELMVFLAKEYKEKKVYPKKEEIFTALKLTSYKDTNVVILGQDPYHQEGQGHGLAFSVKKGVKIPPSLLNIYKEIDLEYGCGIPKNGYLDDWAKQGVLLLNSTLTVIESQPNSHSKIGWEIFTDNIIKILNKKNDKLIFVLWGNNAKKKKEFIDTKKHFILEAAHPSPLSANRGFFGCGHFKKINQYLQELGKKNIDWFKEKDIVKTLF